MTCGPHEILMPAGALPVANLPGSMSFAAPFLPQLAAVEAAEADPSRDVDIGSIDWPDGYRRGGKSHILRDLGLVSREERPEEFEVEACVETLGSRCVRRYRLANVLRGPPAA